MEGLGLELGEELGEALGLGLELGLGDTLGDDEGVVFVTPEEFFLECEDSFNAPVVAAFCV